MFHVKQSSSVNWLTLAARVPILTKDIRREIWAKLWGNMNMNPVSALTRLTANGIFGEPRLFELVRDMMTEFVRVGERLGIALPSSVDERLVDHASASATSARPC